MQYVPQTKKKILFILFWTFNILLGKIVVLIALKKQCLFAT